AGDPAQQPGAEGHHQGIAVDQFQHQRAAPDNDGHADHQTEDDQANLMAGVGVLGGAGNGNDVVQAHDEIGHDDRLDRGKDRGAAGDLVVGALLGQQQLDADPQQQQRADDLEIR